MSDPVRYPPFLLMVFVRGLRMTIHKRCFRLRRFLSGASRGRSAEWHSAVSQNCILQNRSHGAGAVEIRNPQPSATRRYSRVPLCATVGAALPRRVVRGSKELFRLANVLLLLSSLSAAAFEPLSGNYYAHDPSTLIPDGNRYFMFRTGTGIEFNWSADMHQWQYGGQVFPGGPPPWTTNAVPTFEGFFWAPDIAYFNGKYHLYYSISEWGTIDSAIGLVTSPSLQSPTWTDQGKVIQSDASWEAGPDTDLTAYNCIDPSILVESNGSVWMSFGSYSDGILVMPLNPATGMRLNPGTPPTKVADNGPSFFSNTTEASCLYRRGSYYYLFINFGGCCSGTNSTYNIRVGRSASVTGPYLDRSGVNLLNGGGTMVLATSGRFIGPGHAGILSENGTDWLTCHYYDGQENGNAKLGLNRLQWTVDDWPEVNDDLSAFSAFYTFETDAREHLGIHDGQLIGGASVVPEPDRGRVLQLDGSDDYVQLPSALADGRTFMAWAKWNGGGTWQRIFDFGDGTDRYLFLSPRASSGKLRFAITTAGNGNEQILDAPSALPTNSWTHVAVTVEPGRGLLYVNAQPVATNNNMTLSPWEVLARSNYIGKSQWPDPLFNGRIDSFRSFGRALSGEEIRDLAFAHPSMAHQYSFDDGATDSIGAADGSLEGAAVVTNGSVVLNGQSGAYVNLPGGIVSGSDSLTIEFWATLGTNNNLARVFDFGDTNVRLAGYDYLFFSPKSGPASYRLSVSTPAGTWNHDGTGALDGRTLHVACIVDPSAGYSAVYIDGILDSEMTGTIPPLSGISPALSYLGRSLFNAHPWFKGSIDEFRIYDGRLTSGEIAANHAAGPDGLALPVTLEPVFAGGNVELSWPAYAIGYGAESTPDLTPPATWLPCVEQPSLVNDRWQWVTPMGNSPELFRLRR